jgi:hypothetical protein
MVIFCLQLQTMQDYRNIRIIRKAHWFVLEWINLLGEYFTLASTAKPVPYQVTAGLNFDTDAWADSLAEAGANMQCLPLQVNIPGYYGIVLLSGQLQQKIFRKLNMVHSSPTFRKYSVNNWGQINRNLFYSSVHQCANMVYQPIPYIDISDSMNFIGGNITGVSLM